MQQIAFAKLLTSSENQLSKKNSVKTYANNVNEKNKCWSYSEDAFLSSTFCIYTIFH